MGRIKLATVPSLFFAILSLGWQTPVLAQDTVDVSDQDCGAILASYAADPKSVPKGVADACEQAMMIAPGAGGNQAAAAAADPCSGSGSEASVQCWGPWAAVLQPLAGPTPPGPAPLEPFEEPRPELLALNAGDGSDGSIDPDFPVTPCSPGLPCGFATVVAGNNGLDTAENTQFANIDVAPDGSSFAIAGDGVEIQSGENLSTNYSARPGENFENLRAGNETRAGFFAGEPSGLIARVLRDDEGELEIAGDYWSHTDGSTENSGRFAWGRAVAQSDIDRLISGNAVLNFSGPMSVDNSTVANITLNYGATSTWTGGWENPGWEFTAGGGVFGANFVSDAAQFSDNVQEGFVQGALVGSPGDRAVTHIIEVVLDGPGLVRDVGLLTGPGAPDVDL